MQLRDNAKLGVHPEAGLGTAPKLGREPVKMGMLKKITTGLGHWLYPIGMIGGCVVMAILIGVHTATQHFVRSPIVHVTKTNRGPCRRSTSRTPTSDPATTLSTNPPSVRSATCRRHSMATLEVSIYTRALVKVIL
ncbi:hypothetical protein SASPL_126089 [Salvia splendens]|uniref:Uncharacterized protein n=1 Tax=Salvia splendens TaxID=180675 RepID=A0A8X8XGK2_SALSN|nr:hypothetical protein SASPL_126089 [Salvia splendens]